MPSGGHDVPASEPGSIQQAAAPRATPLITCPSCGQHVDKANIRCPRCRQWFVAPPGPRAWSRVGIAAAVASLVLGGFAAGVLFQRLWVPLPAGIVVPADSGAR